VGDIGSFGVACGRGVRKRPRKGREKKKRIKSNTLAQVETKGKNRKNQKKM